MTFSSHNEIDRSAGAIEAEKTLRLIATLPAPEGIEERVKAGLHSAPRQAAVIRWPLAAGERTDWKQTSVLRAAAAAAIVMAVAGGGWEVYSHIRVAAAPAAVTSPPVISGQSGLSAAGTKRVPQTLEGPVIASQAAMKRTTKSHRGRPVSAKAPAPSVQAQP